MQLSQAISGFILFKEAEKLSTHTLKLYRFHLDQLVTWRGDCQLEDVTADDLNRFMTYLRAEYRPTRANGDDSPLSSQSLYNTWTALKSFVKWTTIVLDMPDIMAGGKVPRPKVTNEERMPFTVEEVKRLLTAVKPRKSKRAVSSRQYLTDLRDQAIIITLLDTGIRAGELCALTIGDLHAQTGRLVVTGKGGKIRHVWLGNNARPIVWRYLQERPDNDPAAPLFPSGSDRPMNRNMLHKRMVAIGNRVEVPNANPHRFRYTFAIQYLRNGGDVFTLQRLLGHSSLTMVQYYLKLAQADIEDAHRRASPVDRWLK